MLVLDENVLKLGHTKISLDELPLLVKQFGEHFPFEEIEKVGERFRVNPAWPVAQNGQFIPQPACDEIQTVVRSE